MKRNYVIFYFSNFQFDADQNAEFSLLRLMHFYYTKIGNFHDNFMCLNEWCDFFLWDWQVSRWFYVLNKMHSFYRVNILHVPGTL